MARLRDTPKIIRQIGFVTFLKRVWCQIGEDNVFTWGSALAYSWMFAVFPFLIFLLSLVPLIPDRLKLDAKEQVDRFVDQSIPTAEAGKIVKDQAHNVLEKESAGGFLSFGLLLTLWAASRGMAMTMTALDKAYDIEQTRPFWKHSLIAIGLTLAVTTMIILVMILLPVGAGVLSWLAKHGASRIPGFEISAWQIVLVNFVRYALALGLLFGVTALIYHFGPNLKQKFHAVSPGAIFCVSVWLLLGLAFKLYLQKFGGAESYNKTYGAVAGLVILLLFFYIDSLVLLIGAEINSELDFAAAGIPSGDTPEQQVVAPIPDEENRALAAELQEKRTDEEAEAAKRPIVYGHKVSEDGHMTPTHKTILAIGGLWFLTKVVNRFVTVKKAQEPQTNLPLTRDLLERKYGVKPKNDRTTAGNTIDG